MGIEPTRPLSKAHEMWRFAKGARLHAIRVRIFAL
jgi:hypothetical protein